MRVESHGMTLEAPPGFDVEIYSRPDVEGRVREDAPAILHAANFWLPRERSDFGHEVVETMRLVDIFLALVEYGPDAAGKQLFAGTGVPQVDADSLSHEVVMGTASGQAGAQRFFHVGARAFSLYVVIGSHRLRSRTMPIVGELLRTLRVASR